MGSYLQMGHNTQNLVGEVDLEDFEGIVLSPLNRLPAELENDIPTFKKFKDYNIVLDPQLYYPRTPKDKVKLHPYFQKDFESSDHSSIEWWNSVNTKLIEYATQLGVNTIISPVIDPRRFDSDYYRIVIEVSNHLHSLKKGSVGNTWASIMVDVNNITEEFILMELASIISLSNSDGIYLIFKSELEPRREYNDESQITSMLKLISELKILGKEIIVSFSGSDMILFKYAGATHCGSGNFYNLRRFTKSRYEDPVGGGGQLAYYFDHNLIASFRESDIHRILKNHPDYIGNSFSDNIWSKKIFEGFLRTPGRAWVADGWRQYLSWFSKTEKYLCQNDINIISTWLKSAEEKWLILEDEDILMEEPRNNGKWLRSWRQSISDMAR